jgi:hypothetical protein
MRSMVEGLARPAQWATVRTAISEGTPYLEMSVLRRFGLRLAMCSIIWMA